VPFLTANDAADFAQERGGHVLRLAEVADADVLSAVPIATSNTDRAEEDDFEARLNQLSRERQN
jgi:copper chaperone NosL